MQALDGNESLSLAEGFDSQGLEVVGLEAEVAGHVVQLRERHDENQVLDNRAEVGEIGFLWLLDTDLLEIRHDYGRGGLLVNTLLDAEVVKQHLEQMRGPLFLSELETGGVEELVAAFAQLGDVADHHCEDGVLGNEVKRPGRLHLLGEGHARAQHKDGAEQAGRTDDARERHGAPPLQTRWFRHLGIYHKNERNNNHFV